MKISKFLLSIFLLSVLLVSCDDDDEPQLPKGDYENGILVSGEGSGAASGSITYVSDDFATVEHQIYKQVNAGKELGTYLQSLAFDANNSYVCVDQSNSITVVDRYTFEEKEIISEGLILPRYMTILNGVGYATNWGSASDATDDFVAVIDLDTYDVTSTISVGNGPERIVAKNGKLYVSHKGAWSTNNVVTVIDIASKSTTEIIVKDNPDELFFDNSGYLVVLSEGNTIYDGSWNVIGQTQGAISKINTSTNNIDQEIVFPEGSNPTLLVTGGMNMYYNLGSKIYKLGNSDSSLPSTEFINTEAGYLYGMEANDENLFILDASFSGQSTMDIYNLATKAKTISVAAPVSASKIYFN
ncbi:40-residue YVTN family beta-propeller repeat-containing protein [Lutibacter agarilyticus]|uniref:40-residue YVTN family beta-propeller repeat-containing protein n=1 Tax=Lutibacter agarilyticus TaxID=1109740 RepID=A0A238VGQ5_9FLAO|nr:DUF5074 domain-containing protein [Lutibacter agarilyticus]SNR32873.1 40-residue YVTN family beta-propeller repeat-containing protein [Lutibacter agarilyticus]